MSEATKVLRAGSYSAEDADNCETGKFDDRKIKVTCPNCERVFSALCSPHTEQLDSGWRWVGMDHKEPYATFSSKCIKCDSMIKFDIYWPQ